MAHRGGNGNSSELFEFRNGFAGLDISDAKPELRGLPYNRAVSSVGGRSVASSTDDALELLECSVCAYLMYPPIYQRPNGHTLCFHCKARIKNSCPTCRTALGNIRCLALERAAETLELPCRYQSTGCQDTTPYYRKLVHEISCRFQPFNCPYAGSDCSVSGDIPFIMMHLKEEHRVDKHDGCTFSHRYVKSNPHKVENATWMLTVYNCFGVHFCLHFEAFVLGTAPVYIAFLRFMGDDHDGQKFRYTLEVGGEGRKLSWQGIPRSIRDSHTKVRESLDGLVFHRNLGVFSGGDSQHLKLKVAGQIWEEQGQ